MHRDTRKARGGLKAALFGGAAAALLATAAMAQDASISFDIAAQDAGSALNDFSRQSGLRLLFPYDAVKGKQAPAVRGDMTAQEALGALLKATGLVVAANDGRTVTLTDPQSAGASGEGAGTVEALIVTAQKREEDIQDVPIAISAFTQEDLTRSQIAGGPDLITQVPNMTFTKTNFSSYSVQLRGIGTQAISATTDPAVAVAFNNTPFIRNRFFEQEFYDLQRIEVLRGPQGTLYGRNATAGVVNIISAKPKFAYEAKLSADVSNYKSSRLEGMINMPLVEDKVALRLAGAWTKRDGYATNEISGNPIDGRDLWSTRLSLRFTPTDRIDANLIWEHFQEDDDRLRSGKQLCKKDVVTHVGDYQVLNNDEPLPDRGQAGAVASTMQSAFSQGCARESLYSPDSFQTPNGQSIPYYFQLGAIGLPRARQDPYVSQVQSQDLRVIESTIDPDYRAKADLGELQISFDLTDELTLSSETAYSRDFVYSLQDFNRFNTSPDAWINPPVGTHGPGGALDHGPTGGIFCDPQLGCSDRLMAVDISTARASQFSQELRLASDYSGPFNFSLGANFLRADSEDKYYVFINSLSLISALASRYADMPLYVAGQSDNMQCLKQGRSPGDFTQAYPVTGCTYIDPNPISSINDQGHNYFLSKNPYKLISYAVFGEAYYNITDSLKVTAGLRWTVDKKEAPRIPTWILASFSYGYPVAETIREEWREPTGRLTLDWKPDLGFTDETLLYASFAHGYKAGGANPPGFVRVFYADQQTAEANAAKSETRPKTFDPEFVDAFELGSKNTFLDGRATLNLAAFYYDYKAYQISEIVDRSAFNRNFDATVWGVELEADWRPLENLRLGLKGGYEKTRIADGEQAIDLMDRTAGTPGWSVVRPFPTYASSCILPTWLYRPTGQTRPLGLGSPNGGGPGGCEYAYGFNYDPVTESPYQANPTSGGSLYVWLPGTYPGWDPSTAPNGGEGFDKPLGGNELPNAPHWTATITADYSVPLPNDWLATLHTDLHWQSQSWWRVFNDNVYDKLHPYFTMNLAAIFTNEEAGWNIMAYVKNVTDETAITGAFLNSDDTGLTTNVFLTEPRLYGLRVTKAWNGGPWWTGANPNHPAGEPYPLTVEISGQVQRQDAPYEAITPSFAAAFPDTLNIFSGAQNRDLNTGDERQLKVTWRPNDVWNVSAAFRGGRTNSGAVRAGAKEKVAPACGIPSPYGAYFCDPQSPGYTSFVLHTAYTWSNAEVSSREEHTVVDFEVGREVGLGELSDHSTVSAGVRYAQFNSTTNTKMDGDPEWHLQDGWFYDKYHDFTTRYTADFGAKRSFKGAGPTISMTMSKQLLGSDENGHVNLDWSMTGGALFGKQKVTAAGEETSYYWRGTYNDTHISKPADIHTTSIAIAPRSKSVTVPVVDLSLGLSYEAQRIKVGAGYRWERYFDAIDGGVTARKAYDRTFDGPYFKVSVGFGG